MRYFTQIKGTRTTREITKDEARRLLGGYWNKTCLDDIFENDRAFRLFTRYSDFWTVDDQGRTPMAGFYGIVG